MVDDINLPEIWGCGLVDIDCEAVAYARHDRCDVRLCSRKYLPPGLDVDVSASDNHILFNSSLDETGVVGTVDATHSAIAHVWLGWP